MKGKCQWFDKKKGYGFIAPDAGGTHIFVHYSNIVSEGFKTLHKDDTVEYDVGDSEHVINPYHPDAKKKQAINVIVTHRDAEEAYKR